MSKFQVGDKVVRTEGSEKYKNEHFVKGNVYIVDYINKADCIGFKGMTGMYGSEFFELYQEPAQKTFNPKPGDIIVTQGEGSFTCVTPEELSKIRKFNYRGSFEFLGICYNKDGVSSGWQGWPISEELIGEYPGFRVKEIIPAVSNNPVAIPQQPQDLSFQVKALELENQMLRKLLRREGVEV